MLELFGDVQTFIQRNNDFATVTHSKLLTFFKKALLKAELAVVVDFGVHHRHLSAAANERKRESYLNHSKICTKKIFGRPNLVRPRTMPPLYR